MVTQTSSTVGEVATDPTDWTPAELVFAVSIFPVVLAGAIRLDPADPIATR